MFRFALILAALIALGLGFLTMGFPGASGSGNPASAALEANAAERAGIRRHAFLEELDLAAGDARYALLLHPMATEGSLRAVVDQNALRAAQDRAFYTDDPATQTKTLLMSILFLSPPGMPPGNQFVSVVHDKEVETHFTCYPAYCNSTYQTDTPHTRNLAGLLEASVPVELAREEHHLPDKIRAAHFRALKDPDVVMIDPPSLPPPGTVIFPNRVVLHLPAVLLDTDEAGTEALTPFDEAEFTARFTAAFAHAYPNTESYRLGDMQISTYYPPLYGWPIVSSEFDGYLRTAGGEIAGIDRLMLIEPSISVDLTPEMQDLLLEPDAFAAMPAFVAEPESLPSRLAALAETELGRPCPDCFKIELPVATTDSIKATQRKPLTYWLSYYRITRP